MQKPVFVAFAMASYYHYTKNEVSVKDFFGKSDQIRSFLRIWSRLWKKSLMENFIFCAMYGLLVLGIRFHSGPFYLSIAYFYLHEFFQWINIFFLFRGKNFYFLCNIFCIYVCYLKFIYCGKAFVQSLYKNGRKMHRQTCIDCITCSKLERKLHQKNVFWPSIFAFISYLLYTNFCIKR